MEARFITLRGFSILREEGEGEAGLIFSMSWREYFEGREDLEGAELVTSVPKARLGERMGEEKTVR